MSANIALAAGLLASLLKRTTKPPLLRSGIPPGISVVIPSRSGRELLARLLPQVVTQMQSWPSEIIIVDNGTEDNTVAWLAAQYPSVVVEINSKPLSFARAVNRGIARARFSHVCLLNNDMVIEPNFFAALLAAFQQVPDLFCATAQIFFPEGVRREETGKAVMPFHCPPHDFPLRCDLPIDGEDLTYVLYGSGGCSLYDTAKLHALGGFHELFQPAYVEDLDVGFRGWRLGWPSVFVAGARLLHLHRATTSRYFSQRALDRVLEINYLRFLASAVTDPDTFRRLWRQAIQRLELRGWFAHAWRAPLWVRPQPPSVIGDEEIFALGSGDIAVFPGQAPTGKPRALLVGDCLPVPGYDHISVTFASQAPQELLQSCVEVVTVRPGSPAFHAAIRQTIRKWRPAVVYTEKALQAEYGADCVLR